MVHPLITLYSPNETEFSTNGLGSLNEASKCVVTEVANGEFELELTYPIKGRRYKDLVNRSIILVKPNPIDQPQPFRIYEISRPMNGLVTFYAAHISYDLSGYPLKPFKAESAVSALVGLKSNSIIDHPFNFWTDKNVTSTFDLTYPSNTRTILGGVRGSILDIYGGEYKFDRFLVRLYAHRGSDRGVTIRYGKNLTDLNQEENCSKVYTGVLPYWKDFNDEVLIQLPETILPTEGTYDFSNILTLDLSYEFEEEPTVEELRERAQKYIKDNELGTPKVSLTVSFAQLEQTEEYKHLALLERVELFDTIRVEFPEMNVSSTAKVCKTVYNALTGRYSSVTIGEVRASISNSIMDQEASTTEVKNEAKSDLRREVEKATDWITNGRGYMVAVKNEVGDWIEICSLDTPNIDTAVNVWRWNNGGFGFSSHGYNGPYETAITQDGQIVADFITTGTLTASLIRAGVLQSLDGETFYLDLEAGILKMKATELTIEGKTVNEIATEITDKTMNDFLQEIYGPNLEEIRQQTDQKTENWYQPTDPSLSWVVVDGEPITDPDALAKIKMQHKGDFWYNTEEQKTYMYDGTKWELTKSEVPDELFDKIDGKSSIYVVQPTPPYYVGDTYFQSTTSDILTCINERLTGNFVQSDWEKRNKYIDKSEARVEADAAVDAQTQMDIFNRLTNNGKTQGVYIKDGLLYINATYMKAGIITDNAGLNSWNLTTGDLIAKKITAYGSFRCGAYGASDYAILNTASQFGGYRNNELIGYIDYSTKATNVSTGEISYGLLMIAKGIILLEAPKLAISDGGIGNQKTATYAYTGDLPGFYGKETTYLPDGSGVTAYPEYIIKVKNGIITGYSKKYGSPPWN